MHEYAPISNLSLLCHIIIHIDLDISINRKSTRIGSVQIFQAGEYVRHKVTI